MTRNPYATDDRRWLALEQRDPEADGHFFYSVATTGVYCRPTCPSRLALRKNIQFHQTIAAAEQAGFRACKRCRPDDVSQTERHTEAVTRACRILETAETPPPLDVLAGTVGLSRFHFHRIFKRIVGVTPRQYAKVKQTGRVRSELRAGGSITAAIYGAGFSSSSRFYEHSADVLGMTPGEFRDGGRDVAIRYAIAPSSLGLVLVAGTARGLCLIRFGDDRSTLEEELRHDFPRASIESGDEDFNAWVHAVVTHIEDPRRSADVPLDIRGSAFQQRVWQALRAIPLGQTVSYREVAARIGQPSAVRAVARACAANPVALVVPCHRVVRTDGSLGGYRWGIERKHKLLEKEGAL